MDSDNSKHFVINLYFIQCNSINVTKTSEGNSNYETNNCKNNQYQTVDVKKRNKNVIMINKF